MFRRALMRLAAAGHGFLCLCCLALSQRHFSPLDGFYQWWFAPLDVVCLLLTPMLLWRVSDRLAFVFVGTVTGLQAAAAVYWAYHDAPSAMMTGYLLLFYGLRFLLARQAVRWSEPTQEVRACRA